MQAGRAGGKDEISGVESKTSKSWCWLGSLELSLCF